MPIKYEVDGNIFREINENWLVASVNEYLIQAREIKTDRLGNKIEMFQLNDGRVFTRLVALSYAASAYSESKTHPGLSYQAPRRATDQALTQPR